MEVMWVMPLAATRTTYLLVKIIQKPTKSESYIYITYCITSTLSQSQPPAHRVRAWAASWAKRIDSRSAVLRDHMPVYRLLTSTTLESVRTRQVSSSYQALSQLRLDHCSKRIAVQPKNFNLLTALTVSHSKTRTIYVATTTHVPSFSC